jgi:hypothetical protein
MAVEKLKQGGWRFRWFDENHQRRSRSFKTRSAAERFERTIRAAEEDRRTALPDPLWRKMLREQLGARTEIAVEDFNPHGFFVYLLWSATEDRPLYVGMSTNVLARVGTHVVNPAKRPRITRVTLVKCFSAEDMEQTEGRLIEFYEPELNQLGPDHRHLQRQMPLPEAVAVLEESSP